MLTESLNSIGAPKSGHLRGQVHLCRNCFTRYGPASSGKVTATGEQMGSRFGQAVAAADVNGDQYDDVIVGAPLFAAGLSERGKAVRALYM